MAAKNKIRKRSKATSKVTFQPEDEDPEAENGSGEEEEDSTVNGGQDKGKKAEEEFNLEEVLKLGGTQVSFSRSSGFINKHKMTSYTLFNKCLECILMQV